MTKSLMKICPRCEKSKNRANFQSNGYCKPCDASYHAEQRSKRPRTCRQCKKLKWPTEYNEAASRSCTECVNATKERKKTYVKPEPYAAEKACPIMAAFLYGKLI